MFEGMEIGRQDINGKEIKNGDKINCRLHGDFQEGCIVYLQSHSAFKFDYDDQRKHYKYFAPLHAVKEIKIL